MNVTIERSSRFRRDFKREFKTHGLIPEDHYKTIRGMLGFRHVYIHGYAVQLDETSVRERRRQLRCFMRLRTIFERNSIFKHDREVSRAISTSGNARNVCHAAAAAKALGGKLIGLTGSDGGMMRESELYDTFVQVPESVTHRVQETHAAIYHAVCLTVEDKLF